MQGWLGRGVRATTLDIAACRETFERDGYLVLENFFDAALMDHLDQVVRDYYGSNPDVCVCSNMRYRFSTSSVVEERSG